MDGQPLDPDDDITVVGDHEVVAELRRRSTARPLPPPVPPAAWPPVGWNDGDDDARSPVAWVALAAAVVAAVIVALVLVR